MGVKHYIVGLGVLAVGCSQLYSQDISAKLKRFIGFAKKESNQVHKNDGSILYFSDFGTKNKAYSYQLEISSKDVFNRLDIQSTGPNGQQELTYKPNGIVRKIEPDKSEVDISSTAANKSLNDLIESFLKRK